MAVEGTKISALEELSEVKGTEFIPVVDGSSNKKVKADKFAKKSDIPDVSGFIKTTDADKKYQTKGDYATKSELGNKADKISKQQVSGATPTQALSPNKFYVFGEVTTLTVTLASEISGIYNEYLFQFTSGATATTLNVPSSVKWIGDKTIEKNKTYIVSIVGNLAVLGGA